MTKSKETRLLVENAAKLHGHLGPFLVIGVRMGMTAKKNLNVDDEGERRLRASIKTPNSTPYSCIIDGVQASTCCTVGNRKLKVEESAHEIAGCFRLEGSDKTVKVSVKCEVANSLIEEMSKGAEPKRLAVNVLHMQEEQLFVLEE